MSRYKLEYIDIADSDAISILSIYYNKYYYCVYCFYCCKFLTISDTKLEDTIYYANIHLVDNHHVSIINNEEVIQVRYIVNDKVKQAHFFKLIRISKMKSYSTGKDEAHDYIIKNLLKHE